MTAPARFSQADVTRAIKGARKAGMAVGRAEIDPATGRIIILETAVVAALEANPWDALLAPKDA